VQAKSVDTWNPIAINTGQTVVVNAALTDFGWLLKGVVSKSTINAKIGAERLESVFAATSDTFSKTDAAFSHAKSLLQNVKSLQKNVLNRQLKNVRNLQRNVQNLLKNGKDFQRNGKDLREDGWSLLKNIAPQKSHQYRFAMSHRVVNHEKAANKANKVKAANQENKVKAVNLAKRVNNKKVTSQINPMDLKIKSLKSCRRKYWSN
jgi:hypothetical protein